MGLMPTTFTPTPAPITMGAMTFAPGYFVQEHELQPGEFEACRVGDYPDRKPDGPITEADFDAIVAAHAHKPVDLCTDHALMGGPNLGQVTYRRVRGSLVAISHNVPGPFWSEVKEGMWPGVSVWFAKDWKSTLHCSFLGRIEPRVSGMVPPATAFSAQHGHCIDLVNPRLFAAGGVMGLPDPQQVTFTDPPLSLAEDLARQDLEAQTNKVMNTFSRLVNWALTSCGWTPQQKAQQVQSLAAEATQAFAATPPPASGEDDDLGEGTGGAFMVTPTTTQPGAAGAPPAAAAAPMTSAQADQIIAGLGEMTKAFGQLPTVLQTAMAEGAKDSARIAREESEKAARQGAYRAFAAQLLTDKKLVPAALKDELVAVLDLFGHEPVKAGDKAFAFSVDGGAEQPVTVFAFLQRAFGAVQTQLPHGEAAAANRAGAMTLAADKRLVRTGKETPEQTAFMDLQEQFMAEGHDEIKAFSLANQQLRQYDAPTAEKHAPALGGSEAAA